MPCFVHAQIWTVGPPSSTQNGFASLSILPFAIYAMAQTSLAYGYGYGQIYTFVFGTGWTDDGFPYT